MALVNYVETVPGSDVTAYLGVHCDAPTVWNYSLWSGEGDAEELLHVGSVDMTTLDVTPSQVARIAFLLEVDYASA
jgi:hypothetical protein